MNGIWKRVRGEPAVVTGTIMAVVNVVAAFRIWTPTPEQLASINSALAAFFALIVRASVEPKRGTPMRLPRVRSNREPQPAHSGRTSDEPA
jgi:hypothetical protein